MRWLKNLPISYIAELHNVKIINFSLDKNEIQSFLPDKIKVRDFNGKALVSMVNVDLRKLHPSILPPPLCFNYQHVAFRLLIEDAKYSQGTNRGMYIYKGFTNKPLTYLCGKLFTIYNFQLARIKSNDLMLELKKGNNYLRYELEDTDSQNKSTELKEITETIDKAYVVFGNKLKMVEIQREKWPIEWINCKNFETNFFKSAKLEGAFCVKEKIDYKWFPLQNVNQ